MISTKLGAFGVAAIGMSIATVGWAQDAEPAAKEERRVVIMEHMDHERAGGRERKFRLRHGPDGRLELPEGCEKGKAAADVDEKNGEKRTRILICTKDGAAPADSVAALEKAKARLASDEHLSAETRGKVIAQLDAQIARLRGQ